MIYTILKPFNRQTFLRKAELIYLNPFPNGAHFNEKLVLMQHPVIREMNFLIKN